MWDNHIFFIIVLFLSLHVIRPISYNMLQVAETKLNENDHFQHFWSHIFFIEKKKKERRSIRFQPCWRLDNGSVFHTVPSPKRISCSLPSLNTDGTITRTHTKGPINCCSLLHCTQCKCYLHNGSLLPAQSNIAALRVCVCGGGAPTPQQQ